MEITYLGHSAFRLKGKTGTVVTDPYARSVGFSMPKVKADVITVSHDHYDHNAVVEVEPTGTKKPFVINQAGEYEVGDITVFGTPVWHDDEEGKERGRNTIFSIFLDDVHILHLGDLGHTLADDLLENMPDVDVLLCPVGGIFTIDAQQAVDVIASIEPSIVVPMHYKTDRHSTESFEKLSTVEEFLQKIGKIATPQEKLVVNSHASSEEEVETQVIVLTPTAK